MGKVTKVSKSRREFRCSKCGEVIPVGSTYYRGSLNFHSDIIRCSKCRLQPWEVTTSDYKKSVGEILYNWRKEFGVDEDTPEQIAEALREIQDEVQERLDNMPEGLKESDNGQLLQERIDNLESAADELESIDIEDIKSEIVLTIQSEEDTIFIPKGEDPDDYDIIFDSNELLQERMAEGFTDLLSSAIEEALENIEICGTVTGIIVTAINMASKRADELMEDHQNEKIDR